MISSVFRSAYTAKWTCILVAGLFWSNVAAAQTPVYEFKNGFWFDGAEFESGIRYTVGGILVSKRPDIVSETIDLNGGYVIPPFADGHTHRPATKDRVLTDSQFFLDAGIFYIMNHGNISRYSGDFREQLSSTITVDAAFSGGILSSPLSHSVELWQRLHARGAFPDISEEELDGEAYFVLESEQDLRERWPDILAAQPDFLKIMIQFSEEYEKRKHDAQFFGFSGLNPSIVSTIVDRVHGDGLRVSAHIETAEDFGLAVAAGVDFIAHLPGYDVALDEDIQRYRIREEDAFAAASKGVIVFTTTLLSRDRSEDQNDKYARLMENHQSNLRLLKDAGVRLGVGSDQFSKHAVDELIHLNTLNSFDNLTLLRMICVDTPSAIFPERQIGQLTDGAEASFLVLEHDPLDDIAAIRDIRLRIKQGVILDEY